VDALYVIPRQDGSFTQIEKGWSVQGLAVSGNVVFDYNWPDSACWAGLAAAGSWRALRTQAWLPEPGACHRH
jgi:hypothetical protein